MSARRHGQGALAPPARKYFKVLFVLQVLSKVSVDEVFMHYFERMSSASLALRPDRHLCSWTLLGDFRPSDPLIAHPWKKNPAGAHAYSHHILLY